MLTNPVRPHGIFNEDENGKQTVQVAWVTPAKEADAIELLQMPRHDDGRSDFFWMRMQNGTLLLGVFPQGDNGYIHFSDSGVCDYEDAQPENPANG